MVSLDDPDKNRAFAESVGASFVLLSDEDKNAAERYGVLAMGGLYARRITFYIDAAGKIVRIDRDVDAATHGPDVIQSLEKLGFPKRMTSEKPKQVPMP